MNDDLSTVDEFHEFVNDVGKLRFVFEKLFGNTMHFLSTQVDVAIGREVIVEAIAAQTPIQELDTTEFDDAMTLGGFQPSGFQCQG